jgi:hypothetical protein
MRILSFAVAFVLTVPALGEIDAGVARRQYCEDSYQAVYLAARHAVQDVGASIIHSDESGGTIVGRIEGDIYGHIIEISVWINRDRDQQAGAVESIWVQVTASIRKVKKPNPDQLEQLKHIEDQVFGLIRKSADCGPPQ